jgi:hypothetical protein
MAIICDDIRLCIFAFLKVSLSFLIEISKVIDIG